MIAWGAFLLGVAMFVLVAAFWCAVIAARHARVAAEALQDTKAAIVAWWTHVGPAGAPESATDMANALAERKAGERRHWTAAGR